MITEISSAKERIKNGILTFTVIQDTSIKNVFLTSSTEFLESIGMHAIDGEKAFNLISKEVVTPNFHYVESPLSVVAYAEPPESKSFDKVSDLIGLDVEGLSEFEVKGVGFIDEVHAAFGSNSGMFRVFVGDRKFLVDNHGNDENGRCIIEANQKPFVFGYLCLSERTGVNFVAISKDQNPSMPACDVFLPAAEIDGKFHLIKEFPRG